MAAIVASLSRATGIDTEVAMFKTVVMFFGVGLLVSLLFATYGRDAGVSRGGRVAVPPDIHLPRAGHDLRAFAMQTQARSNL